jgi:hypothetical protein
LPLPLFEAHLGQLSGVNDPSVGNQDVQPAELLGDLLGGAHELCLLRGDMSQGMATGLAVRVLDVNGVGDFGQPLRLDIAQRKPRAAFLRETVRANASPSPCAAPVIHATRPCRRIR